MEIRLVTRADAALLAAYYKLNAPHFRKWEPGREEGYYSEEVLSSRLQRCEQQHLAGEAAHFVAVAGEGVIAHCSLTGVMQGPFKACYMGYGVAQQHEGHGVMTEVCKVAIDHAFGKLQLNRIMANHMPVNTRSARLLNRLGFVQEGLARCYLQINGKWEDHVLNSLLASSWLNPS
jgi:[ribosomal protein S5]-alanine N-acetyltransferase